MSRSGRRIAPLRVKAGRSCSGSRGRRRSGDWAAAYVRFVCHRRAGKVALVGACRSGSRRVGPGLHVERGSWVGSAWEGGCACELLDLLPIPRGLGRPLLPHVRGVHDWRSVGEALLSGCEGAAGGGDGRRRTASCGGDSGRRAAAAASGDFGWRQRASSCRRRRWAASCGGVEVCSWKPANLLLSTPCVLRAASPAAGSQDSVYWVLRPGRRGSGVFLPRRNARPAAPPSVPVWPARPHSVPLGPTRHIPNSRSPSLRVRACGVRRRGTHARADVPSWTPDRPAAWESWALLQPLPRKKAFWGLGCRLCSPPLPPRGSQSAPGRRGFAVRVRRRRPAAVAGVGGRRRRAAAPWRGCAPGSQPSCSCLPRVLFWGQPMLPQVHRTQGIGPRSVPLGPTRHIPSSRSPSLRARACGLRRRGARARAEVPAWTPDRPLRGKAGRSCSGSRGRRRSGDWAAAYVRLLCQRRAGGCSEVKGQHQRWAGTFPGPGPGPGPDRFRSSLLATSRAAGAPDRGPALAAGGGGARTHARMRRRGRRIGPVRGKAGRSCSGSRGGRRSGDWAAACCRLRCCRRADYLICTFNLSRDTYSELPKASAPDENSHPQIKERERK
ncbi:translation initiation factor IF-2-like [Camelus ferus]|uniref:Translation initiation factor IF-2-like n=1 Tax=Camelus ferus TaxID=419612 RepID=A0A8B8RJX7_CAMFR|nr:translation initiation factor IF-2-like [Camelus ferus]